MRGENRLAASDHDGQTVNEEHLKSAKLVLSTDCNKYTADLE